jgi:hypothetical protein
MTFIDRNDVVQDASILLEGEGIRPDEAALRALVSEHGTGNAFELAELYIDSVYEREFDQDAPSLP